MKNGCKIALKDHQKISQKSTKNMKLFIIFEASSIFLYMTSKIDIFFILAVEMNDKHLDIYFLFILKNKTNFT